MTLLHHPHLNPWRDLDRFFGLALDRSAWAPSFDITETDKAFVISGDLPGVQQGDIEVRMEGSLVTVRGERKPEQQDGEVRRARRSRPVGSFRRTFVLPDDIDGDATKASFENGVLSLMLPKAEPVDSSRLIPVN